MTAPVVVTLRPGLTLAPGAAGSWARMEAERRRQLDVNSSYRDWDEQMQKYRDYLAYKAGIGPWAPLALHPDASWHCKGLAVDTDDDGWIRKHPDHGWRFVVRTEKWHAQYYPEKDTHKGEAAGGDARPFPDDDSEEEEEMKNCAVFWFNQDGSLTVLVFNPVSRWKHAWTTANDPAGWAYNDVAKTAFNCGEKIGLITVSHAEVLLKSLEAPAEVRVSTAAVSPSEAEADAARVAG